MAFEGDFLFCKLNINRECNVVDARLARCRRARSSSDVLTFQAVDNRTAHDGNLVFGFLDKQAGLNMTDGHIEGELDDVTFLPFTGYVQVGRLAIYLHAITVAPIGLMQFDGSKILRLLHFNTYFAVPWIICGLLNFKVLQFQSVLAVKIDVERLTRC